MAEAKTGSDGPSELIGLEYLEREHAHVRARLAVTDDVRQPHGVVHGGIFSIIAESICSRATGEAHDGEAAALGQSSNATLLRPISSGYVNAEATARHQGRTTWVWDVEITDDEERVCALVRMTVAVRERP